MLPPMNQTELQMEHQRSKFEIVYEERIKSLLTDRFCCRFDTRLPSVWVTRFKHMSNGNEVVLKGYPADGKIMQWTNHVVKHIEYVD